MAFDAFVIQLQITPLVKLLLPHGSSYFNNRVGNQDDWRHPCDHKKTVVVNSWHGGARCENDAQAKIHQADHHFNDKALAFKIGPVLLVPVYVRQPLRCFEVNHAEM